MAGFSAVKPPMECWEYEYGLFLKLVKSYSSVLKPTFWSPVLFIFIELYGEMTKSSPHLIQEGYPFQVNVGSLPFNPKFRKLPNGDK